MESPGVYTFERDKTFSINSIESSASAMVGLFRWGPVNVPTRITTNEQELVDKFGAPDEDTSVFFHSAANYLLYVTPLYVTRAIDETVALNAVSDSNAPVYVGNESVYDNTDFTGVSFLAKYPGTLGNAIGVSAADDTNYTTWAYANEFIYSPEAGEFNMVVIDETGEITGTAGTILERYELMTINAGDKKPDGSSAYVKKVLNNQSNWLYCGDETAIDFAASDSLGVYETSMQGGVDGNVIADADFDSAIAELNDSEALDIISVFASAMPSASVGTLIDAMQSRLDAVAFLAPALSDVYNNQTVTDDIVDYFNTTINKNHSYAFYVDNWKLVYDRYNDKNIWIPVDSDAAAMNSRVFVQNEPWFSPAGLNRGQLKNVIRLAWSANKQQRDILYKESINSVVAFDGEGTVLWGDKTALKRPSAFSRINVRNLFIVLKKSIARASKYQLFELNDEITRSIFRNAVNRYLENVKGRRGVYRYRVIADGTNNTPQVINTNQFVGDIYIDPARSINTIKLNFIAVDAGVDFKEVEGV